MPTEEDAAQLEQDAGESHLVDSDHKTASEAFQKAAKIREELGDDLRSAAEYLEELLSKKPRDQDLRERAATRRCEAAKQYAQAFDDLNAAAVMEETLGNANAAAKLRDRAAEVAKKGAEWLEECLDRIFEEGELTRTLRGGYLRLSRMYRSFGQEKKADRARKKADLVRDLAKQAAAEAAKALKSVK